VKTFLSLHFAGDAAVHRMRRGRVVTRAAVWFVALVTMAATLGFVRPGVKAQTNAPAPKADSAPAGNTQTGNVQTGKKLFTSYGCYECHGRAAHGGTGPRLGPDAIPFSAFLQYVRHPAGTMPPYTAKVTSDQDLADIYAFLTSLPASPKAKSIPLLQ
jgi:mono/diheme cytochrome c family protein